MQVRSLGQEDLLEESLAIHSSILAWRTPRTEEHNGLWSIGSQRARHHWRDFAPTHWWMDKQSVVYHIIAYYSAIKKIEIHLKDIVTFINLKKHYTKWKDPNTEHHILSDSTYRKCPKKGKTLKTDMSGCLELGWEWWLIKWVWGWKCSKTIVGMVTHLSKLIRNHWIVHLKWINLWYISHISIKLF